MEGGPPEIAAPCPCVLLGPPSEQALVNGSLKTGSPQPRPKSLPSCSQRCSMQGHTPSPSPAQLLQHVGDCCGHIILPSESSSLRLASRLPRPPCLNAPPSATPTSLHGEALPLQPTEALPQAVSSPAEALTGAARLLYGSRELFSHRNGLGSCRAQLPYGPVPSRQIAAARWLHSPEQDSSLQLGSATVRCSEPVCPLRQDFGLFVAGQD